MQKQFSIPLKGLKIGHHDYAYKVGNSFFDAFEQSPYSNGDIAVKVELEKKSDHLVFDLSLEGTIETDCDRCTDSINFPITFVFQVMIKYDIEEREEEEIIYINPEAMEFNCANLVYEAIQLAIPLIKTCDAVEGKACNPDILDHFQSGEVEENDNKSPLAEALKNLKLN